MKDHIENLKEMQKVFCNDCEMRKGGVSCCLDPLDTRLCDYIASLKFAIKLLEEIYKENITIK